MNYVPTYRSGAGFKIPLWLGIPGHCMQGDRACSNQSGAVHGLPFKPLPVFAGFEFPRPDAPLRDRQLTASGFEFMTGRQYAGWLYKLVRFVTDASLLKPNCRGDDLPPSPDLLSLTRKE